MGVPLTRHTPLQARNFNVNLTCLLPTVEPRRRASRRAFTLARPLAGNFSTTAWWVITRGASEHERKKGSSIGFHILEALAKDLRTTSNTARSASSARPTRARTRPTAS